MIVPVRLLRVLDNEPVDRLVDGVEAMHHQMVAQQVPAQVLAVLDTDVDEHERLLEQTGRHHPFRKLGSIVATKIHGVS